MSTTINPVTAKAGKFSGMAYGAFMGYVKPGGQWLHYECRFATVAQARARVAAEVRKARGWTARGGAA